MTSRVLGGGLAVLLVLATLNEGGATPLGLLLWHAWLVGMVVLAALTGRSSRAGFSHDVLIPFGLFLAWFALGAARVPYGYAALLVLIELACTVAVVFLAGLRGPALLRDLLWPLGLVAGAHGFHVLYQALVLGQVRPHGTFLNPNHLGLWLTVVLLLGLGSAQRRTRLWLGLLGLPILAGVLLSSSRGAVVALLVGAGWLLAARFKSLPSRARGALLVTAIVVLGLVAARQLYRLRDYDPFRYHRVQIWKASLEAVVADPWWGTGPGQFATAAMNLRFPDGEGPLRYDRAFSSTHSDVLRVPCELGVPAALALLCAVVAGGRTLWRRRRAGDLPPGADAAIAALLALATAALFDNPSRWPAASLLAGALAGSLLSRCRERPVQRLALPWRMGLGALVVLVFLLADVAPFRAWRAMTSLPAVGRLEPRQLDRLQRALELNPIQPGYHLRLAEHLSSDRSAWDPATYADAREAAEQAVRLQPADARHMRGLARIEALGCRTLFRNEACRDRARERYEQAEALSRYDPSIPVELAGFLLDTGDAAGARRAAGRALALEPGSVLPRLVLADALMEEGTEAGLDQAAALLGEARQKAADAAAWSGPGHQQELLRLDPDVRARLERRLAASRAVLASR